MQNTFSKKSYPISATQVETLIKSSHNTEKGKDVVQLVCRLPENLELTLLEYSWRQIWQENNILCTTFDIQKGVQYICENIELPWNKLDWRDSFEALHVLLEDFLNRDRLLGFQLNQPPLMRLTVIQAKNGISWLICSFHKVLLDWASLQRIFRQMGQIYQSHVLGEKLTLSPLGSNQGYISWLAQQDWANAREYWRNYLAKLENLTPFGMTCHVTKKADGESGYSLVKNVLSAEITTTLKSFADQQTISLEAVLQGAWAILLKKYGGESSDIVFGAVHSKLGAIVGQDIVGFFDNVLPAYIQISSQTTALQIIKELNDQLLKVKGSPIEHLPLSEIQKIDGTHQLDTQLFDTVLGFEDQGVQAALENQHEMFTSWKFELYKPSNFPLTVNAFGGKQLEIQLLYSCDLLSAEAAQRVSSHFCTLLKAMVETPLTPVAQLSFLTESERHQLLMEWNDTQVNYPQGLCIHQMFETQVEKTLENVAVVFRDQTLSYQELNEKANHLAHYLQTQGVGPDVLVAICAERSPEMVIGLLGILKSGGAYLPLDPGYPPERLDYMLENSRAPILLTQKHIEIRFEKFQGKVIYLDENLPTTAFETPFKSVKHQDLSKLAYVLYTSGSTGQPKGAMIHQQAIANYMQWVLSEFSLSAEDVVFQKTPFSFDASVWEFYMPLLSGGKLVMAEPGEHVDPSYLIKEIKRQGVTILQVVPTMLDLLLRQAEFGECHSLRLVFSGGEALNAELAAKFPTILSNVELINLYGPTETTIYATSWRYPLEEHSDLLGIIPIGRPVANTQVYILDGNMQPLAIGLVGELYIGGAQVGLGYLNRLELTAEKFIDNPFGPGKLYKTGDLARYLPDGNIEYLGRIDHQVKIRGFRVELGEIETAILDHPAVQTTVVVARADSQGQKRLVGYITLKSAGAVQQEEIIADLRAHLKAKLPEYMVPSALIVLEQLPLNVNGKIDRKALPEPEDTTLARSSQYEPPEGETEQALANLWADLLGLEKVGRRDNFFELGGDSIISLQFISRAQGLGLYITPRQVFEAQTIEALAQAARRSTSMETDQGQVISETASSRIPEAFFKQSAINHLIQRRESIADVYPLSPMQAGMLFHSMYEPKSGIYFLQTCFHLEGSLDLPRFKLAWQKIVNRHTTLRTAFIWQDLSQPLQIVYQQANLPWQEQDWRGLSNINERLEQLLQEERSLGFVLDQAPLARCILIRVADDAYEFIWECHHLLTDGWSDEILFREAFSLYNNPDLSLHASRPYHDYIDWLAKQDMDAARRYWSEKLIGFSSPTPLGVDIPSKGHGYETCLFELPIAFSTQLQQFARQSHLTLNTLVQGAYALLLSRYSGETDVLFGVTVNGRTNDLPGIEERIGPYLNTLPLRISLSDDAKLLPWLEQIQRDNFEQTEYSFTPLIEIQKQIKLQAGTSLFESILVFENYPAEEDLSTLLGDVHLTALRNLEKINYPLAIVVFPGQKLGLNFMYDRERLDQPTVQRMAGHLQAILEAFMAAPEQTLRNVPILTEAERHQLLVEWNNTAVEYPRDLCIHQLFEAQVEKTPDAVAVTFEGQSLTYRVLNQKSNQLAYHLQTLGLSSEDRVGICIERSIEMVIALVAILKAGAAYVPLELNYPKERLQFILEDTQVSILLTQSATWQPLGLADGPWKTVYLDLAWKEIGRLPADNLRCDVNADSLAYIMYTSGSTGKPKGSAIVHRNVVRLVKGASYIHFGENESFLQLATLSFDASTLEIWGPLLNGGRLVVFPAHMPTLDELGEALHQDQITTLWLTAGLFHQMVDTQLPNLRYVRQLLAGGDVLSPAHVCKVLEGMPAGNMLVNGYGPTENTTFTCCYPMTTLDQMRDSIPIGKPISNTTVYILDKHLRLVPIGVTGELYIGGDGLAREYWNHPQLTAERFVDDPFSSQPNARLYKTGDLVRYLPDGNIEFVGREDFQVKVRGYRVELGEVESVLSDHAGVQDVVVLARLDTLGNKQLVAYLIQKSDYVGQKEELSARSLREFVKARLPEYMVPANFIFLENFPLTANGKIDRGALPQPSDMATETETSSGPRTPTEEKLYQIWANILDIKHFGVNDNFFDLGGHSLLATRLLVHIRSEIGVDLPLRTLFDLPTIAELSKQLENLLWVSQQKSQGVDGETDLQEEISI